MAPLNSAARLTNEQNNGEKLYVSLAPKEKGADRLPTIQPTRQTKVDNRGLLQKSLCSDLVPSKKPCTAACLDVPQPDSSIARASGQIVTVGVKSDSLRRKKIHQTAGLRFQFE